MPDYQKMYYTLFNAMSESTQIMLEAMQSTEELYISDGHIPLYIVESLEKSQELTITDLLR